MNDLDDLTIEQLQAEIEKLKQDIDKALTLREGKRIRDVLQVFRRTLVLRSLQKNDILSN